MTSGEWDLSALKALEEEEQKEFLALSQKSLFETSSLPVETKQVSVHNLIDSVLLERERKQQLANITTLCDTTNYVQLQAHQLFKLRTINEHHNHKHLLQNKTKSSDSSDGRLKFTKALSLSAHSLTNRLSGHSGGGLKRIKKNVSSNSPSYYGSPIYTPPTARRCHTLHHSQSQVRKVFKTLQQLEKQKQEHKEDILSKSRTLQRIAGTNKTYWKYGIHSTANYITQQHQLKLQQRKSINLELESNTSSEWGSDDTRPIDNKQLLKEEPQTAHQSSTVKAEYDDTNTENGSCSVPFATDSIEMMNSMLTAASTAVKTPSTLTAAITVGHSIPPDIARTSYIIAGNSVVDLNKHSTLNHHNPNDFRDVVKDSNEETVACKAFHDMRSRRKSIACDKLLRAQTLQRNSSLQNYVSQQQTSQTDNVNNKPLLKSSSFEAPLSSHIDSDINSTTLAAKYSIIKLKSHKLNNTPTSGSVNENILMPPLLQMSCNKNITSDFNSPKHPQQQHNQSCHQNNFNELHNNRHNRHQHHVQNRAYYALYFKPRHVHNSQADNNEVNTGTSSPLIIDNELEDHIKQCSCSCNHMGYGNSMDYQTTSYGGLPDVTEHSNIRHTISRQNSTSNSDSGGEMSSIQKSKVNFNDTKSPSAAIEATTVDVATKTIRKSKISQLQPHRSNSHHHHLYHNRHRRAGANDNVHQKLGRSSFVIVLTLIVALGLLAVATTLLYQHFVMTPSRNSHTQRLKIVTRILREVPLVDGHNNFAWNVRKYAHSSLELVHVSNDINHKSMWVRPAWAQTDFERLKQGHVGVQVWSAYVPCESQGLDAVQLALEQIDIIRRLTDMYKQDTVLVQSSADIQKAQRDGLMASLIGIEGGHAIGSSLGVLRSLYSLGARYLSLTHKCDVSWASSSAAITDTGLTQFGKAVVREMNRLGMMIDLSYSSDTTSRDVLQATRAPVIFSHSGARQLCNSTRNVPDDILRLVAENGGLIMISFDSEDVTCGHQARLKNVVEHIKYIRGIAGVQHIGLGAGYDSIELPPLGLEDVSKYPDLLAALLEDPNWSEDDIAMLAGKNFLRIMETVENVREFWKRAAITPIEQTEPQPKTQCTYMPS